jgi:hypothetical protein
VSGGARHETTIYALVSNENMVYNTRRDISWGHRDENMQSISTNMYFLIKWHEHLTDEMNEATGRLCESHRTSTTSVIMTFKFCTQIIEHIGNGLQNGHVEIGSTNNSHLLHTHAYRRQQFDAIQACNNSDCTLRPTLRHRSCAAANSTGQAPPPSAHPYLFAGRLRHL